MTFDEALRYSDGNEAEARALYHAATRHGLALVACPADECNAPVSCPVCGGDGAMFVFPDAEPCGEGCPVGARALAPSRREPNGALNSET